MSACSKIRHIVRIRQLLRRWRRKAAMPASRTPSDVPAGHVAVSVGMSCKRYVVRTAYLNHPVFKKLLARAEEEYGFANTGPLTIPCEESVFEEILQHLARAASRPSVSSSTRFSSPEDFQWQHCSASFVHNLEFRAESRPLLNGVADKPYW